MAATTTSEPRPVPRPQPRWHWLTRLAFRFCVLYFGLYIVLTQMLTSLLFAATNDNGAFEVDNTHAVQTAVAWVAAHVFHIAKPLVLFETGSGDRVYDWVEVACMLALALFGTLVWTVADRKRAAYPKLLAWSRLGVRFALAATLLTYGAVKVFPLQMPFPGLQRLVEPYGNFSPMGVLWSAIGASPHYEFFAGAAEMLGGVLLLIPALSALGAIVGLADAMEVFILNMTYDVPVKLLSFHMIPMALFLLAPDARRLWKVLVRNQGVSPAIRAPLFRSRLGNRLALLAQLAFGAFLVGANLYSAHAMVGVYGANRPKSALYGIWDAKTFAVDGQPHPALITDAARWRRVIFDVPKFAAIESMTGGWTTYGSDIDFAAQTLTLTRPRDKSWQAVFRMSQPAPGELALDGMMDGRHIEALLSLFDRSHFLLVRRGFHWIQDYPYNR
jgi:uncharacterized membrane protein YphA (DoxX/SURF4 family)